MASFYSVLGFLSLNAFEDSQPGSFDVVGLLPPEVASTIFRLLPAKDLLNAACVSKTWKEICKHDVKLRRKLRLHFRKMRKARLAALIRGDNFGRRIGERPEQRANMSYIGNIPLNIASRIGSSIIYQTKKMQFQVRTFSKRPGAKIKFCQEKAKKARLRM